TTLMAVMMDRHSQVAVPPETHFFLEVFAREFEREAAGHTHEALLKEFGAAVRAADMKLDPAALAARFAPLDPTYPNLFRAVLETYAAGRGKQRAGEKTPEHLHEADRLLRLYPDARIICMVRDGREVVLSLRSMPWGDQDLRRSCLRWNKAIRIG